LGVIGLKEVPIYTQAINIIDAHEKKHKRLDEDPDMYWIWGKTGSGKSTFANITWPDAYIK
jgi:adenylylsulfate kinase-like enzyme